MKNMHYMRKLKRYERVIKIYRKMVKQKWRPEPTLKNGAENEKPYE
jgi:pentatricopeptide repeat protein